jgi:ligand-binding sensor domain-containing protein
MFFMKFFALFISLFAVSFQVYGQDDYVFENFNTKQGLISNETKQIVQDKKGFLWISSVDGISRFDGYQFVNHRLTNIRMYCAIAVDEQGILWAASDKSIYQYDESKQVFTKYLSIKTKPNYKIAASGKSKSHVVVGLLSHHHQLWLATDDGLFLIVKKQLIKTSITQSPYPSNIIGFDSDRLLLTSLKGTYIYNIPQNSYQFLSEIKHPQSIFVDSKKQIWWGDMGYLYRMSKHNTVHKWLIQLKGSKKEYYSPVNTIAPLPTALTGDTMLWVGLFGHGIYQFNTNTETFDRKLSLQFGAKNGLSSNQITNIVNDQEQNLWIASFNGIDKCDYHVFRFKNEDFPFFYELEIERLRQIVALPGQPHLSWVATTGNGLFLYDNQKRQVMKRFLNEKIQKKQSNNVIYEIKMDKNENLWISTGNTLIQIEPKNLKLKRINLPLQEKSANSIDIDDDNNLGVGSSSLGRVFFFNVKTSELKELDKGGDIFSNVFDIAWDKHRKRWWLATEKGLFWCDAFMNTAHKSSEICIGQ